MIKFLPALWIFFYCLTSAFAEKNTAATRSDDPIDNYNAGVASYRKADFKDAKERFTRSLITENKTLEKKAEYNIGNALFKIARSQEESRPDAAIDTLKQALRYYHQAIESDPGDLDAKYNHELAQKVLKILLEKPKPPQPQKQDDKKDKQDRQENQGQQDQQQKQDRQQQQGPPKDEQQENKGSDSSQNRPGDKPEKQEERDEQKGGDGKEEKLSEEEARMLAAQFGQEGPRMNFRQEQNNNERSVQKDW